MACVNAPAMTEGKTAMTKETETVKALRRALRTAAKKLPLKSEKARNHILEWAAGSMAEAYEIGAEEAQGVILTRIEQLIVAEIQKGQGEEG